MASRRHRRSGGVAELGGRLESWRRERERRRMPEELWRAVAKLAESEGVSAVARAPGLNYRNPKRRLGAKEGPAGQRVGAQPLFVELGRAAVSVEMRCVVEIEDGCGLRMAIRLEGQAPTDVAALGGALWKACR